MLKDCCSFVHVCDGTADVFYLRYCGVCGKRPQSLNQRTTCTGSIGIYNASTNTHTHIYTIHYNKVTQSAVCSKQQARLTSLKHVENMYFAYTVHVIQARARTLTKPNNSSCMRFSLLCVYVCMVNVFEQRRISQLAARRWLARHFNVCASCRSFS